jgi:chromosomal replication initiator protein
VEHLEGQELWARVLSHLEHTMAPASFKTWMQPTRVISEDNGVLFIGCSTTYAKEWLETRLMPTIRNAMREAGVRPVHLRFEVSEPASRQPSPRPSRRRAIGGKNTGFSVSEAFQRYTFESFVVGDNNRFAHAAAEAVAERPGRVYMPLFIYGGVGLGKTHLLHAIGVRCRHYYPSASIVYTSLEKFMGEFIKAVADGATERFQETYRSVDLLLVDDIQFISGKEGTQDEFFHTFNTLHANGKQVVISSDRAPKMIVQLEERLLSRFEWGLVADIQPPDLETRIAILRRKAEQQSMPVPADVMAFIARRAPSNIRELEGSFNRVLAYARVNDTHVSLDLATAALDSLHSGRRIMLTPTKIIEAVAQYFKVTLDDIEGKSREKGVVVPRQVAMYLAREETNASLDQIGHLLGDRDHTTVMHGYDRIVEEMQRDHQLRNDVVAIRTLLYNSSVGALA